MTKMFPEILTDCLFSNNNTEMCQRVCPLGPIELTLVKGWRGRVLKQLYYFLIQ